MKSRFLYAMLALLLPALSVFADGFTIYYDNSATQWESVGIHYWGSIQT